jgi:soluble lytic murein transglycosylase-like protein
MHLRPLSGARPLARAGGPRTRAGALLATGLGLAAACGAQDLDRLLASNDAGLQAQWAVRFEHGEGVARDPDAAVRLYCRAARAGARDARYRLGWMYANGRGVARDDAQAAAWFQLAAADGDAHAARMLARLGEPAARADCVRPDGQVYLERVQSVPSPTREQVAQWVQRLAPQYELDPALVLAVIRAESNFDPRARSPKDARGLMQLIPATASRFGVADVWDPLDNLRGGMAYLRWLLETFEGDETLALAGYNAGEGAVLRYRGVPPYAETQDYVRKVSRWRRAAPVRNPA